MVIQIDNTHAKAISPDDRISTLIEAGDRFKHEAENIIVSKLQLRGDISDMFLSIQRGIEYKANVYLLALEQYSDARAIAREIGDNQTLATLALESGDLRLIVSQLSKSGSYYEMSLFSLVEAMYDLREGLIAAKKLRDKELVGKFLDKIEIIRDNIAHAEWKTGGQDPLDISARRHALLRKTMVLERIRRGLATVGTQIDE